MNEQSICLLKGHYYFWYLSFLYVALERYFEASCLQFICVRYLRIIRHFVCGSKCSWFFFITDLKFPLYHRWATHSWFCFFNPIVHIKLQVNPIFWQHLLFSFNVTSSGIASASEFGGGDTVVYCIRYKKSLSTSQPWLPLHDHMTKGAARTGPSVDGKPRVCMPESYIRIVLKKIK